MTLYDQIKLTEVEHATPVQESVISENRHDSWWRNGLLKPH